MIADRLQKEIEELQSCYPSLEVDAGSSADGSVDLLIPDYQLPAGWSPAACEILVVAPVLYPDQQPDNFWAELGIQRPAGGPPANCMGQVTRRGRIWDQYSWHWGATPWDRDRHNMVTFVRSISTFFERQT